MHVTVGGVVLPVVIVLGFRDVKDEQQQVCTCRQVISCQGMLPMYFNGRIYYPPEVSSMKYCCLGEIRKEYFRLVTK